jgi:hypothetical protein
VLGSLGGAQTHTPRSPAGPGAQVASPSRDTATAGGAAAQDQDKDTFPKLRGVPLNVAFSASFASATSTVPGGSPSRGFEGTPSKQRDYGAATTPSSSPLRDPHGGTWVQSPSRVSLPISPASGSLAAERYTHQHSGPPSRYFGDDSSYAGQTTRQATGKSGRPQSVYIGSSPSPSSSRSATATATATAASPLQSRRMYVPLHQSAWPQPSPQPSIPSIRTYTPSDYVALRQARAGACMHAHSHTSMVEWSPHDVDETAFACACSSPASSDG